MAKNTSRNSKAKAKKEVKKEIASTKSDVMGLVPQTWVGKARRAKGVEARSGKRGFLFFFTKRDSKVLKKILSPYLNKWQVQDLLDWKTESLFFQGPHGPIWLMAPKESLSVASSESLDLTDFAFFRDVAGAVVPQLSGFKLDKLIVEFHQLTVDQEQACLVGLEIASYSYAENRPQMPKKRKKLPEILIKMGALSTPNIESSAHLGFSVNMARQYTNIPGGDLNPRTFAESIESVFSKSSSVSIEVWQGEKLVKEKMSLLLAVGGAAAEGPRFVHMKYRPKNVDAKFKPVALVGKGITFDSGGLDLKPSSGMRLMKKDMGGAAAVVAILKWADLTQFPFPLDGYVSLAENAVGSRSFRPGDIFVARNEMTVEISNTDAEGRLVLADALDVAVSQEGFDKPEVVINIATLTGAIKVGLGAQIAGLFSNNNNLSKVLFDSGVARGDLMWRMPLYQSYRSQLKSDFADVSNCSEGGFGGAITAALFLESFVKDIPWAHLDIYAWKDSAGGAWTEKGGSGQPVLALTEALTRMARERLESAASSELTAEELA